MKMFRIKIIFLFSAFAVVSCIKDPATNSGPQEGKVRLTLYTNAADYSNPATRGSADETGLADPIVLVFEGTGNNAEFTEAAQSVTLGSETTVSLTPSDLQSTILLVTNAPGGKFRNSGVDAAFTADNIAEAMKNMRLLNVRDVLRTELHAYPLQTVAPFASPQAKLPVAGITVVPKIEGGVTLGTSASKVMLTRSVARASVTVDAGLSGFTLSGAGAVNAPRNGSFYNPEATLQSNTSNVTAYLTATGTAVDGVSGMAPASGNTTAATPLYLYEAQASLGTALIIKGKYEGTDYYYKLAFYHEGSYLDILRNKDYKFTVRSAGRGYLTMQEAIDGNASNIVYDIDVTDATAHDMISNGLYYLGLSNSRIDAYGGQTSFSDAFTVTTDAGTHGVSSGTITYETTGGTGTITGPTGFTVTGNLTAEQISLTIPQTVTAGTATVTVGTLVKTVSFVRNPVLPSTGFARLDGDYVSCQITQRGTGNWLAASADGSAAVTDGITLRAPGSLYLMAEPHIGYIPGTTRSGGELYAVTKYSDGSQWRTKIYVQQEYLELAQIPDYSSPDMYVGAFWRESQTGERLIYLPFFTNAVTAGWTARVLDGEEWIKLDTEPTSDPGVTWSSVQSPADMNDPANDALYQVTEGALAVSGYHSTTIPLYFRIGLRSAYTPTEEAPVRYGRILVTYNDGQNSRVMYIRQGERADYLMRPVDNNQAGNITTDWGGTAAEPRPLANKYSPYNVTAPQFNAGATSEYIQLDIRDDVAETGGGVFTDYPSQAGAFFKYAGEAGAERYAYNPVLSVLIDGTFSAGFWSAIGATHETCPRGYRRPQDGPINVMINTSTISISEQRQSLWLNPPSASQGDYYDNAYMGYYADGFFDRRQITTSAAGTGAGTARPYTAVEPNSSSVGYRGRVYYNPETNASLFFPTAGFNLLGALSQTGYEGWYWMSTTHVTSSSRWVLYTSDQISNQVNKTPYNAITIRCVVDK